MLHRSRWRPRRPAPAPGHERYRLLARRARGADAADRSRFPLRGGLGEPQGSGAWYLRRVLGTRRRAWRDEGAHPHHARARRASRGPDGQRVRNAADAARPVRSAARSAALHGGEGGSHPRQSASDPGEDARLREVRSRPRLQPAGRGARPARVDGRERALAGDRDAGLALPADEAIGQPARLRPRRPKAAARSSRAPTRARSWSSGTGRRSRRACWTSRSRVLCSARNPSPAACREQSKARGSKPRASSLP